MPPSAKEATPQATASSIIRLLQLSQRTLQRTIHPHTNKENINGNLSESSSQYKNKEQCIAFVELAEVYDEFREYLIVFKLKGAGSIQNLMESRSKLELFAKRIEEWSSNCHSSLSIKQSQQFAVIDRSALEIVQHLRALISLSSLEVKPLPPTAVENSNERRSLLTQRLRQAELQQLEAELILKHVRSQMKESEVVSPLMEFNTRQRTAPIRLQNPLSFCQQALNFSLEPSSPQKSRSRIKTSSLLSEMSFQPPAEERRVQGNGVGCSRCQIY